MLQEMLMHYLERGFLVSCGNEHVGTVHYGCLNIVYGLQHPQYTWYYSVNVFLLGQEPEIYPWYGQG